MIAGFASAATALVFRAATRQPQGWRHQIAALVPRVPRLFGPGRAPTLRMSREWLQEYEQRTRWDAANR